MQNMQISYNLQILLNTLITLKISNEGSNISMQKQQPAQLEIIVDHQPHTRNSKFSYILILLSATCWVSGFIYPNEVGLRPWQTNLFRAFPLILMCYLICKYKGYPLTFRTTKDMKLIMVRNAVFILHDLVTAAMQFKLPLPILHNINNSMSIIVMIIELLLQGKKLNATQKISTAVTMLGIACISNYRYLQPLIRPSYQFKSDFQNYSDLTPASVVLWSFFFLCIAIMLSFSIYMSNKITMNVFQINFHCSLALIVINSILFMLTSQHSSTYHLYLTIPISGIIFAVGDITFTGSIMFATNVGVTMLLGSFTVVVSYFWSIFRYHEQVSVFCLIGSGFIVYGIYKILITA